MFGLGSADVSRFLQYSFKFPQYGKDMRKTWGNVIMINHLLGDSSELEKTLVIGLYHRFKKDKDAKENEEYIKESPFDFEYFVAKTLEREYGGEVIVTNKSGDGGIDIVMKGMKGYF